MVTESSLVERKLSLPDKWVDTHTFDNTLCRCGDVLGPFVTGVIVDIPPNCKLMIDVIVRLLSLCNQLSACTKRVRLHFGDAGTAIGYLNRMGFFDHLAAAVEVYPHRPTLSGATIHRGSNKGLVEIERFNRSVPADKTLAPRLAETVKRGWPDRADRNAIESASFSIFSELIGNVYEHSGPGLDAYAALQTYPQAKKVTVTVSDSGMGIMASLKPAFERKGLTSMSEVAILVEMFRRGISSKEEGNRGLGLMTSGRHAIRFNADLDVRLLNQRVLLRPSQDTYQPHMAYSQEQLPLLWGTHISFSFRLD